MDKVYFYDYHLRIKANRLITKRERDEQLKQSIHLDIEQHYWGSLIKANSTCLESLDPIYQQKGQLMLWLVFPMIMSLFGFIYLTADSILKIKNGELPPNISMIDEFSGQFMFLIGAILFAWPIKWELFSYSHLPMRLNRKTRMIHIFRYNGTVLSVPWDKVFFTLGRGRGSGSTQPTFIAGHMLDEDGKTVRESFVLGGRQGIGENGTLSLWEFLRRYMEEGLPEAIKGIPEVICLPMDRARESFSLGLTVIKFEWGGPQFMQTTFAPLLYLQAFFRWIAMRTSKVPVWPKEVEDVCLIEPDDPCVLDVTTNPEHARFGW